MAIIKRSYAGRWVIRQLNLYQTACINDFAFYRLGQYPGLRAKLLSMGVIYFHEADQTLNSD